jgi:hypothetical protein
MLFATVCASKFLQRPTNYGGGEISEMTSLDLST